MKLKIIVFAFLLGVIVGFAFIKPQTTGAVVTCYSENEPCLCDNESCKCGNETLPAEYCSQDLNTESDNQQTKEAR